MSSRTATSCFSSSMSDGEDGSTGGHGLLDGFPPAGAVYRESGPRFLILGSFPSVASLERKEYYGNPRNHFWLLMATCFDIPLPLAYEGKIAMLRDRKIALWDVFASCERKGSLDKNIANGTPNAIVEFVEEHPSIVAIGMNGGASASRFVSEFAKGSGTGLLSRVGDSFLWESRDGWASYACPDRRILVSRLPSSSPVPTSGYKSVADKLPPWFKFFTIRM